MWLLHKYEAHNKGLPICFSEVQVKNDVTDNNNKHFVTAFEGECRIIIELHEHLKLCFLIIQVNLDMTDSMGPGKLVRHMQNPSYTYGKYLICMGLGPSILTLVRHRRIIRFTVVRHIQVHLY